MKKKVKALVIAASVAAIAGIGAVSFAAWDSSTTALKNDVTGGELANITTVGFATGTDSTVSGKLVPHDQVQGVGTNVREYVVKLVVTGDSIANYEIHAGYTDGAQGALETGSKYIILVNTSSTALIANESSAITGWKDLGTTATKVYDSDLAIADGDSTADYYAHIALVSSNGDDMGKGVTFNFELKAKASA